MDKQKHPLDELFHQKLQHHTEKPSALAWEKLESQLGSPKNSRTWTWLRVAAVFIGAFVLVYLIWQGASTEEASKTPILAEEVTQPASPPQTVEQPVESPQARELDPQIASSSNIAAQKAEKEGTAVTTGKPPKSSIPQVSTPVKEDKPLMAEEIKAIDRPELSPETGDLIPELEVPELKMDKMIAENSPGLEEAITPEPVTYKISIKSSGISEKPKKENLVEEIGDKINTLGGLLGKVDEGYAGLQDAKNNLFASLITKKESKQQY